MWTCPMCSGKEIDGHKCTNCGFDERTDFIRYRTICPVPRDEVKRRVDAKLAAQIMVFDRDKQEKEKSRENVKIVGSPETGTDSTYSGEDKKTPQKEEQYENAVRQSQKVDTIVPEKTNGRKPTALITWYAVFTAMMLFIVLDVGRDVIYNEPSVLVIPAGLVLSIIYAKKKSGIVKLLLFADAAVVLWIPIFEGVLNNTDDPIIFRILMVLTYAMPLFFFLRDLTKEKKTKPVQSQKAKPVAPEKGKTNERKPIVLLIWYAYFSITFFAVVMIDGMNIIYDEPLLLLFPVGLVLSIMYAKKKSGIVKLLLFVDSLAWFLLPIVLNNGNKSVGIRIVLIVVFGIPFFYFIWEFIKERNR